MTTSKFGILVVILKCCVAKDHGRDRTGTGTGTGTGKGQGHGQGQGQKIGTRDEDKGCGIFIYTHSTCLQLTVILTLGGMVINTQS